MSVLNSLTYSQLLKKQTGGLFFFLAKNIQIVIFTGFGKFPVGASEQGSAVKSQGESGVNRPDSLWLFLLYLFSFEFWMFMLLSNVFLLSAVPEGQIFILLVHTGEFLLRTRPQYLCMQIVLVVYVCAVMFVGVKQRQSCSKYSICVWCACVCVYVCLYIYKRDRWQGKESWGNEKWPIKCFSHPFPKCCMLWCFIPKKRQALSTKI